jgi:hypothetical protein
MLPMAAPAARSIMQMAGVTSKRADQGMIPKSGNRFSEKIMPNKKVKRRSDSAKLDQT